MFVGLRVGRVERAVRAAPGDALRYGGMTSREFLLNEGIGAQCFNELRRVNIAARVLGIHQKNEVQQVDVLVAAFELDRVVVDPVPVQKPVERDDPIDQGGQVSAQIGKRAVQGRSSYAHRRNRAAAAFRRGRLPESGGERRIRLLPGPRENS